MLGQVCGVPGGCAVVASRSRFGTVCKPSPTVLQYRHTFWPKANPDLVVVDLFGVLVSILISSEGRISFLAGIDVASLGTNFFGIAVKYRQLYLVFSF